MKSILLIAILAFVAMASFADVSKPINIEDNAGCVMSFDVDGEEASLNATCLRNDVDVGTYSHKIGSINKNDQLDNSLDIIEHQLSGESPPIYKLRSESTSGGIPDTE